jgi:hypothetical protein
VFSNYDRQGKCEWYGGGLDEFVSQYNHECATEYAHTECLDIVRIGGATAKQPEVLVTDKADGKRMVIERKSVVWPSDFILKNRNEQAFAETIWEVTAGRYNDACYELIVSVREMEKFNTRTVKTIANEIGSVIAGLEPSRLPISGATPVNWVFGRANSDEQGDRRGIVVIHQKNATFEDFLFDDSAKTGTASAIEKELGEASPKFDGYPGARRVVLLDFYGTALWEDDIPPLMLSVTVPANIDEVWMTKRDWVSEEDFDIGYERLFLRHPSAT